MPQRQPSQHQAAPAPASQERTESQPQTQPPALTRSPSSEDSEVVILDHGEETSASEEPTQQQPPAPAPAHKPSADEPDSPVKKCWICFSDSNEDTPETSPWRDPCPCALVAHEECLLDWIADMESPNSRNRSRTLTMPQITCPQCKSEIKLSRPRNYIVDVARGLERLGSRMVWPGALTLLSGLIVQGNFALGMHTVYRIFGAQDGFRILRPLMRQMVAPPIDLDLPPRLVLARLLYNFSQHLRHWRLYIGVPLITPILVLSRTALADSVLPALPVLFLATQAHSSGEPFHFTAWPPSASMAFAVLPYLRSAYNAYYERVWAKKEQQWIREVQPRASESQDNTGERAGDGAGQAEAPADEDNMFEVRIDGGIWDDWDGGNANANVGNDEDDMPELVPQPEEQLGGLNAPPVPDRAEAAAAPPPNIADNRRAQPAAAAAAAQPQPQQNERRLSFSTTAVAETIMGALAFPTLAEISGEVLRLTLPTSWTTSASRFAPRGLLQEKWGRSLVGGCLFIVIKDALLLYTKWRSARMHRERRVLDVQRKNRS
jgi:hypothetical protein